jgi:hypothetical protein
LITALCAEEIAVERSHRKQLWWAIDEFLNQKVPGQDKRKIINQINEYYQGGNLYTEKLRLN